jgi:putative transposase
MMAERGIGVDHSTVHRWVIKLVPLFEKTFCKHKYPVGKSWRMDETSSCALSVMPCWSACIPGRHSRRRPLYVTDADPRPPCSAHPALHPGVVTIHKSGSNLAALHAVNAERETPIKVRQVKYLNNVVEQDHRAIKRRTRPMLGFKDFDCARVILSGIEVMHMIKEGQMKDFGKVPLSAAQQFYSLVS